MNNTTTYNSKPNNHKQPNKQTYRRRCSTTSSALGCSFSSSSPTSACWPCGSARSIWGFDYNFTNYKF